MKVYCAIDFFFENWDDAGKRKFWMAVLPYVSTQKELKKWVETAAGDGSTIDYELIAPNTFTDPTIVYPVPLSLDTNFQVRLSNGESISLERTTSFVVTDPQGFRALNTETPLTPLDDNASTDALVDLDKDVPYAVSLVQHIQEMFASAPDSLPTWLQLAFEIGQRRKFNASVMGKIGPYMSVEHPEDPDYGQNEVTNLHCLAGLMLELPTDVSVLNSITQVEIDFLVADNVVDTLSLAYDPDSTLGLTRFFSTIKEEFKHPKSSLDWLPAISQRVYAMPAPQLFARQTLSGFEEFVVYRRPRGGEGTEQIDTDLALSQVQRLLIRYSVEDDKPHPVGPPSIPMLPVSTFDLITRLFRGYPRLVGGSDGGDPSAPDGFVMQLVAQPHDVNRWFDFVQRAYEADLTDLLAGINLISQSKDGTNRKISPSWVQIFRLPWELEDTYTVLMYVANEDVTGNVLAVLTSDDATELDLSLQGLNADTDPFGPRWEHSINPGSADFKFDALILRQSFDELDDLRLIISAYTEDDFDFELAQSARRIEAVAKLSFDRVDHDIGPGDVDAEKDFQSDYENHNAALLISSWQGSSKLLNSASESTADYSALIDNDTKYLYTFHTRFMSATSARMKMPNVRQFYAELYPKIGVDRTLKLELEHTYGTRLDVGDDLSLSTPLDEKIVLPVDIGERVNDEGIPFLVVDYTSTANKEHIALVVDRQVLSSDWDEIDESDEAESRKQSHIEAWQSVAELVYAERITVTCQAYRFDFHSALESGLDSLGGGLVPARDSIELEVTDQIQAEMEGWLNSENGPSNELWTLLLDIPGDPLWQDSHVVRFYISVTRKAERAPDEESTWHLASPLTEVPATGLEDLVGEEGYKVKSLNSASVKTRMETWMKSLQREAGYLTPKGFDPEDRDKIERYRGLFHRGPNDSPAKIDSSSWIIPEGIREGGGDATVTVVPVGFRPFERSLYLGDATDQQIMKYFLALQPAINLESELWAKDYSAQDWLKFFAKFDLKSAKGKVFWDLYEQLCDNIKGLLHPVPSTLPPAANEDPINQHVVNAATALKSDHEIAEAVKSKFGQKFRQLPSIFATAKSLVYHRITGNTVSLPAPADLYSMAEEKAITEMEEAGTDEGISDSFAAGFEAGLRTADKTWFGFLETLDDSIYDNDFHIMDLRLKSAEDLLEDKEASLDIVGNEVFVPAEHPLDLNEPESGKPIYLASRQTVRQPALVTSGIFSTAQTKEKFEHEFPDNTPRELSSFLMGRGEPPSTDALPVKKIASFYRERSTPIDDVMMSYVFTIRGDEEFSSENWLNGLVNDAFYVEIRNDESDEDIQESVPDVSPSVEKVFRMLQEPTNPIDSPAFAEILENDTLEFVKNTVSKKRSPVSEPTDPLLSLRIAEKNDQAVIEVKKFPRHKGVSIHLFQVDEPNSQDLLYIWISVELSIWQKHYLSLQQSRNLGNAERRFEPEFGMLSLQESSKFYPRQPLTYSLEDHAKVELDVKKYSTKSLLESIFVADSGSKLLTEIGDSHESIKYAVNITISDIVMPSFPVQKPGKSPEMKPMDLGVFPVRNIRVETNSKDPGTDSEDWVTERDIKRWFPNGNRIRLDVEWRREDTNDILLRLEGLEVWLKR